MNAHCLLAAAAILTLAATCTPHVSAREIHVAKIGNDAAQGDRQHPFRTIGKAADVARAGDTVTVHAGTYREWVQPRHGGDGPDRRIVYRAARGEKVIVTGSEPVDYWKQLDSEIWQVVLPNSFFGNYNPYALKLSGGWLNYGQWHHRGDVYLNGKAFYEKQSRQEVEETPESWWCEVDDQSTTIVANFAAADPNAQRTEINVRECLFMPTITGLNYVTVDGFQFLHAAANWAPPVIPLQTGAVGPRMGKGWIIENCTISDIRCVGIILGQAPGADYDDIDSYGDHVVRNNVIRRCGQAAIAGQKGATRSLITHNLIEETNYRKEFGGWETAAIKFHNSVDTVIQGNLIRGVYHQMQGAFGIWIDFGNQGTRITGNIIYNTQAAAIFLEMNHGPTLVDNNLIVGRGLRSNSENTVFAHNMWVDCDFEYASDTNRRSQYFAPHTTEVVGRKTGVPENEKWFNNIFVTKGLAEVQPAPGFAADFNAYLAGADKSSFGDQQSVIDSTEVGLKIEDLDRGAAVQLHVSQPVVQLQPPPVDSAQFGVFPTVEQALEDRHRQPIRIEQDMHGKPRTRRTVGPLAELQEGLNQLRWELKK